VPQRRRKQEIVYINRYKRFVAALAVIWVPELQLKQQMQQVRSTDEQAGVQQPLLDDDKPLKDRWLASPDAQTAPTAAACQQITTPVELPLNAHYIKPHSPWEVPGHTSQPKAQEKPYMLQYYYSICFGAACGAQRKPQAFVLGMPMKHSRKYHLRHQRHMILYSD
jgi:hypothetical protein